MDFFNYNNNQLFAEDIAVKELAEQYGTPCYIYSRKTFERHYRAFADAAKLHKKLGMLCRKSQLKYCRAQYFSPSWLWL